MECIAPKHLLEQGLAHCDPVFILVLESILSEEMKYSFHVSLFKDGDPAMFIEQVLSELFASPVESFSRFVSLYHILEKSRPDIWRDLVTQNECQVLVNSEVHSHQS